MGSQVKLQDGYINFADKQVIQELDTFLKNVHLFNEPREFQFIAKNFKNLIDYTCKLIRERPNESIAGYYDAEKNFPRLFNDIKDAVIRTDWSEFYSKYRDTADDIINAGRTQGIFDVAIHAYDDAFNRQSYPDFKSLDAAAFPVSPPKPPKSYNVLYLMVKKESAEHSTSSGSPASKHGAASYNRESSRHMDSSIHHSQRSDNYDKKSVASEGEKKSNSQYSLPPESPSCYLTATSNHRESGHFFPKTKIH